MTKNYLFKTVAILLLSVSALTAQDYTNLIKDNLIETRSAEGLEATDVAELTIYNQATSRTSGVEHVYAVQNYNGIEIFNGNVSAAFRGEELIHIGDNTVKGVENKIVGTSPVLTPVQAASSAAALLGAGSASFTVLETISSQEVLLNQGGVSFDNVPVKLVYQLTDDDELRLAWDLSIHMIDQPHWYSVRVDAASGEILNTIDWIVSCSFDSHHHEATTIAKKENKESFGFKGAIESTALAGEQYNVYAVPLESPLDGDRSIVTEPQDLEASPQGWHDTNGVAGAEFTITRGNNVWAFEDVDGMSDIGESPDGGEELIFDFPLDDSQDASTFIPAATTNLFYWNNILHDVMYQYGFDEASGNFQANNYGNGGTQNDFVFALAQDGSGTNNATFGTPPDGQTPTMRMFLWTTSGEDAEVIVPSGPLAGEFPITMSNFSAIWPAEGTTGDLVLAMDDDAAADAVDPLDICDALINPTELEGNIAVLRRGQCNFSLKVETVQAAGAIAVIIVNNVATAPINLGGASDIATIPAGMVTQAFGEDLIAALLAGDTFEDILITGARRIDGDLDNGIIGHEYGHGISTRLTGGRFNSGCLGGNGSEGNGMGEGWSDYYGLMLTMKPGDTAEQGRGIGNYAVNQPTTGPGIRPRRYSTNFAVNDLTYLQVANTGAISQPHGIGTVWATMIWNYNLVTQDLLILGMPFLRPWNSIH